MAAVETADEHRLDVFVRSYVPVSGTHSQRTRLLERLSTATEHGLIDEYSVDVLGEGVCLCHNCQQTGLANQLTDTIRTLRTWRDGSMSATGFTERYVSSSLTQEEYRTLVPPELAVGIYVDGSLSGVFPCGTNESKYSVAEYLDTLFSERDSISSTRNEYGKTETTREPRRTF
jgi:hypothetical protein